MRIIGPIFFMVGMLFAVGAASSQQSVAPIVRAKIDPPRVVVGQRALLTIEVLAPNYMSAPPELPDFQIRNLAARQTSAVNFVEQHDGATFAGVRYEVTVFPMEAGVYAIAGQKVTVTYAADPPATRKVTMALPALSLEGFIPAGAGDLKPFLAAGHIAITQKIEQSATDMKVGDSLTRTVTITADGIPAMLIPPVAFAPAAGFALYPSQPVLQDVTDRRSDTTKAVRIDQAVYLMQQAGDYSLPGISLAWWNIGEQKIEHAQLDPISLHVADNPAVAQHPANASTSLRTIVLFLAEHWLLLMVLAAALAMLLRNLPRGLRWLAVWRDRRRAAYAQSEKFYFARLRRTANEGDAARTYFALLDWLDRFEGLLPDHSISGLKAAARDPEIDTALVALEENLFDRKPVAGELRRLGSRLAAARRRLRRHRDKARTAEVLPTRLNPAGQHDGALAA